MSRVLVAPPGSGLGLVPGLLVALLPKCPLCLAPYASLLGVAGVERLAGARWVLPLMAVLLVAHTGLLLVRALRRRCGPGPVCVSVLGSLLVLGSRLLTDSREGAWVGVALLLLAALWNVLEAARRRPVAAL